MALSDYVYTPLDTNVQLYNKVMLTMQFVNSSNINLAKQT